LFNKKTETDLRLENEINALLAQMKTNTVGSDEYTAAMEALSKLMELKESKNLSRRISPDTLAIVVGNLIGVIVIVSYEKHNIVTSKALTFVQKLK
jgi:hypothetical protein